MECETRSVEESQGTGPCAQIAEMISTETEEREGSPDWDLPEGDDSEKD